MSEQKDKKNFDWQQGEVLDDKENYAPVKEVRSKGLPKLKKALHADPIKRKKERDNLILSEQSKPYQKTSTKTKAPEDKSIIVEESQSGLSDQFEDSKAKKLIEQGQKIRGLDRFGKKQ